MAAIVVDRQEIWAFTTRPLEERPRQVLKKSDQWSQRRGDSEKLFTEGCQTVPHPFPTVGSEITALDTRGYLHVIFFISQKKEKQWLGTHWKHLSEKLLMSTHVFV